MLSKLAIPLLSLVSAAACAQVETMWGMSIGAVDNEYGTGINLTAGYGVELHSFAATINFIDLNIFSGEPEGYHKEELSNGNEVCRNEKNGQFSKKENCEKTDADFGSSIELGYINNGLTNPTFFGVGSRFFGKEEYGGEDTAYATVIVFNNSKKIYGQLKAAPDYTQLSIGLKF